MQTVTVVGPGRMGGALSIALGRARYRVERLVGRNNKKLNFIAEQISPRPSIETFKSVDSINSDIIFVTTPDPVISEVAAWLAGVGQSGTAVFHASGALSSRVLHPLASAGCVTGSIHPLLSVSSANVGSEMFSGVYFCVEGERKAKTIGKRIVERLGGKSFTVDTELKPLYHLAAVLSAGHLVALADISFSLMARAGLKPVMARRVLLPLIKSTVANLESKKPSAALTGPYSRGDLTTVESHLDSLNRVGSENEINVYLDLALRSIEIAMRNRTPADLEDLRQMILLAKENSR